MDALLWILLLTLVDGFIAFVGIITLWIRKRTFQALIHTLVALSAGTLLAGALFHMLGESLEYMGKTSAFGLAIVGFILFFLIEKILKWRHCHERRCRVHPFTYLILLGDGVHNFIDGLVIAASFLISIPFGLITSVLIIGHEIPQELGDFGVLVYGGMSRKKALLYNFLTQMTCVLGGILGFYAGRDSLEFVVGLLPLAAGGFIYISASDLIPELHKETNLKRSLISFLLFLVGIILMIAIKMVAEG